MQIDPKLIGDSTIEGLLVNKENLEMLEELLATDEPRGIPDCDPTGFSDEAGQVQTRDELDIAIPEIASKVDDFLGYSAQKMPGWKHKSLADLFWERYKGVALNVGEIAAGSANILYGIGFSYSALKNGLPAQAIIPAAVSSILNGSLWVYIGARELPKTIHKSKLSIGSTYKINKEQMWLIKVPEDQLVHQIAHEYAHHLQYEALELRKHKHKHTLFIEGHARGVQRSIARDYAIQRRNKAFWKNLYYTQMGELSATFAWMCDQLKVSDRFTPLYEKNDMVMLAADYINKDTGGITLHAKGNTLFYLAEKKHGQQIYGQAMQGNLEFMAG